MNKYQKALNKIWEIFKFKFNTKEINVAQELIDCKNTLQELVDKVTPKKIIKNKLEGGYDYKMDKYLITYEIICPACKTKTRSFKPLSDEKYCHCCGQALDWSEIDKI